MAGRDELLAIHSVSYVQPVVEYAGEAPREMAVEITRGLVELPYETFIRRMPVDEWGVELDGYLGGEVKIYERDEKGRVVRQLERMVVSPMPFDAESKLSNNDMTKVEVIRYDDTGAKVYWRVMHSDNGSTEADVGSVEFRQYDDKSTLITFHSAHRLNLPGGIHISNGLVRHALEWTFTDFVAHYAELVAVRGDLNGG